MFGLNKIFLFLIGFVLILNLSFGASSYSDFRDKTFCDFLAEPSDNEKTNLSFKRHEFGFDRNFRTFFDWKICRTRD